ncbi:MAG: leucine--tRNA ligase [Halobacteria archaeon]|nr:leucine--tRNA ligase [Halobacteria archaeon]
MSITRSRRYDHREIEEKWQKRWEDEGVFEADDGEESKYYVLGMFPYTSGVLHMGHVRNYTITDAYARYKKMEGHEVLHPMGWDSFGLPAENAAIERDTNPRDWTFECIDTMKEQMKALGFGYDWEREVTTCKPEYYRWNQWLFKRFYEEDLVEYKAGEVNWCPSCETVLANEQVEGEDRVCWRCDTPVEKRSLDQWYFKITEYADELLEALEDLEGWPDNVRQMQRNWIGRQEGAKVEFEIRGYGSVDIFTTRLDTIFGATYMALAPEHPIAHEIAHENQEVKDFIDRIDRDREVDPDTEKEGVFTGEYAVNPINGEEIPVYVADFVMMDIGTGAIMAVPGHDERDHQFARKYDIEIRQVIEPEVDETVDIDEEAFTEDGVLVNSGDYTGMTSEEARQAIVEDYDVAEHDVEYRLRDWLISRQRYWGTPIPVVHCDDCGRVLVPDEDLPVELPGFVHTTGNPLDEVDEFVNTECPECGEPARRETDTMDTFVDSSWYFLRYASPDYEEGPFDTEVARQWMPVDQYVGGIEHAVMHLLYSRFFTRVLNELDLIDVREPFTNLLNQGMILNEAYRCDEHGWIAPSEVGENHMCPNPGCGRKLKSEVLSMSKSKKNGVSPQRIVDEFGADTARLFIMGASLPEKDFEWSQKGVESNRAFIERLYDLVTGFTSGSGSADKIERVEEYIEREIDVTVASATESYEEFRFNHAVRDIKNLVSTLEQYSDYKDPNRDVFERGLKTAVKMLSPIAPHVCEELWDELDGNTMVAESDWPVAREVDEDYETGKRLVENTRRDVREIRDVAGISEIDRIRIIVAPEWKYRAYEIARETEGDVMGEIMSNEEIRKHGDEAANYGQYLQRNHKALEDELTPEKEAEYLRQAKWLFEREFKTDIVVESAEESDSERASNARPGKPAIHIQGD